jgi:hypothetical protein
MNRRKFLITLGDTVLLLVLPALSDCSGTSSPNGLTATSTPGGTDGHYHQFTIPTSILNAPPPNGYQNSTSVGGSPGHTHTVNLSPANLNNINSGQTVLVTTTASPVDGHSHQFSFHQ